MFQKLFSEKKYKHSDLLDELLKPIFNEDNVNRILNSGLDINWKNSENESFLHLCSKKNLVQSMQWLIKNGVNVEIETDDGETSIFYAVHSNAKEAIAVLLKNNANVDHQNIYKRTALQEAVISDTQDVLDLLIKYTKNINNIDDQGHNLIFDAVANGNKNIVAKIANNKELNINQIDNNGNTILHQSTVLHNNELAIQLMEEGADPTIKDKDGKNFLFYAAVNGIESESLVDKAISLGCNINSRSDDNQTILMETILAFTKLTPDEIKRRESLLSMIKKLIEKGAEVDSEDNNNETALFIAVRAKDIDTIVLLLEADDSIINHQNLNSETVLSIAILEGIKNLDLILILLDYGADANIKDKNNQSVIEKLINIILHFHNKRNIGELSQKLAEDGQYMVVLKEVLQGSDIDLLSLNSQGKPLFFDSIFYSNEYLFKLLKNFGADINQKDIEHQSIIYNLMEYTNKEINFNKKFFMEILRSLVSMGADVNSRNKDGGTTVHKAILDHCDQTVKVLLDSKADTKAIDKQGRSLVHNCVWQGKVKHFKLLHSYNKEILNTPDKYGILPINYAAFMGQKDLVLEMIRSGSFVNNTHEKNLKMIENLMNFFPNLETLTEDADSALDKKNIKLLIQNMKKEFQ